eukprot:TRINITY_DN26946_c0_g1_i4.p1 TRINITY_DN26946_c0_g1~~TRINITY_DN26946_c0_g1_i4.p1  ORF type:complete len:123 (-),score=6.23 TRINITY_DN26946_c0_g1_i4:27-395(-)
MCCKRCQVRQALIMFSRVKVNNNPEANDLRHNYSVIMNQYKALLRNKQQFYRQQVLHTLNENAKDPKQCTMRSIRSSFAAQNSIPSTSCFLHFEQYLNDELTPPDSYYQEFHTNDDLSLIHI